LSKDIDAKKVEQIPFIWKV